MESLQKTIEKAVSVKGPDILAHKTEFCNILEDLNPENITERQFLERIYSDEMGNLLAEMLRGPYNDREKYYQRIDSLLQDTLGLGEESRYVLIHTFRNALREKSPVVQKYMDYRPALQFLKQKYGEEVPIEVIRYFVEDNRLFARFSITVDDVENDLIYY